MNESVKADEMLLSRYGEGEYELAMSIYRAESRYPRVLAPEDKLYSGRVVLKAKRTGCYFMLQECKIAHAGMGEDSGVNGMAMWYMNNGEWIKSGTENGDYVIPVDVFDYVTSHDIDIIEAACIIGYTRSKKQPGTAQCRELNIHCY